MAETKSTPPLQKEIGILRAVFKDNDALLISIRCLFFGLKLTQAEKDVIKKTFSDLSLREAFRKKFYAILDPLAPIGEVADFWLDINPQISGMNPDTIQQAVFSKNLVLKMLNKSFLLLDNPDGEQVSLNYNPDLNLNDPLAVNLIARNTYLKSVETGLFFVKKTAESVDAPTMEETKKKLAINSSK